MPTATRISSPQKDKEKTNAKQTLQCCLWPNSPGLLCLAAFEIRALIWLNFFPCGDDGGGEKYTPKTDLAILCTNPDWDRRAWEIIDRDVFHAGAPPIWSEEFEDVVWGVFGGFDVYINTPGTDVNGMVADYYLRIHINFWRRDGSPTANNLRREMLRQYFTYGTSTTNQPSAFEQEMLRIAETYPDLMEKYDRDMKVLTAIQRIVVCAYNQTRKGGLTPSSTPSISWDRRTWKMADKYLFWEAGVPPIGWDEDEDEHEEAEYFANIDPHYGGFSLRAYPEVFGEGAGSRFVLLGNSVEDWLRMQEYRDRERARERDWDVESLRCSSCSF
ncbi:hypothetical protein SI65_02773 [Aspergillus cristatus]|uniref:Uncharacterized protein n=1 Tax=Aspergillus cristatus TaxID=573508 RepID=A0A1E3BLW8_ASPCR|nr:hypothetical protein SI65_02773 [Aspergillus cristatus]